MNLSSTITDNITELLTKIIEFTQARQKVLTRNINRAHEPGFVPQELAVDEFSESLHRAIHEHVCRKRLLLCDTENVKFGFGGSFEIIPIRDVESHELLKGNFDEYLEIQIDKLMENSLNQRVAAELLRQRQGMDAFFEYE